MISFITNLLRTVIIASLLNVYLKHRYPKKYDDLLVSVSFNAIYMFSVIQIKLKNVQKYLYMTNPRIVELLEICGRRQIENNFDYVLDGKIIYSTSTCSSKTDIPTSFDFIIYSDYKSVDNNKKILENVTGNQDVCDYEKSDIKFLLVEFKIGEKTYKIDLKTDAHNFYIVGNRFTKQFFQYYLTEILKTAECSDKFSLKIIDHEVNNVELDFSDENDHILLEKTGYKLSIVNKINDNSEEKENE